MSQQVAEAIGIDDTYVMTPLTFFHGSYKLFAVVAPEIDDSLGREITEHDESDLAREVGFA
ncbi:hypothetical protein [Actinomadura sediminis]|uniref:Uncharacterized protein n=1 Tax=Actinomadura sediminis TaxID=1038904 RepID=A0ABW3EU55_9ACTN